MKKRLESELISIAHRILKLKNKSEVDQLYKETQKLYETLAVLKFYNENFNLVKDEVSEEQLEQIISNPVSNEEVIAQPIPEVVEELIELEEEQIEIEKSLENEKEALIVEEDVVDESFEENDLSAEDDKEDHEESTQEEETTFKPVFELEIEEETNEEIKEVPKQITFESFLGEDYTEPVFVKPNDVTSFVETKIKEEEKISKNLSINDSFSKSIEIGLNDKIAFVKHLFAGSNEDYSRVMSQLNTFDTYDEVKNFLNDMVIPDYNYWIGKEEYIERFMEIVEKKFK